MFLQPLLPFPVTFGSAHEVFHLYTPVPIPVLLLMGQRTHDPLQPMRDWPGVKAIPLNLLHRSSCFSDTCYLSNLGTSPGCLGRL